MNTEQLRSSDFGTVDADAAAWRALADALNESASSVSSRVLATIDGGAWQGAAADRAGEAITAGRERLTTSADEAERIAGALAKAANEWRGAQGQLRRACDQAPALGLRIDPDGTARPLPGQRPEPNDMAELTALATEALAAARNIDAELASVLSECAGLAAALDTGAATVSIPTGKTPAEIAAWWKALSPAQRRELIAAHPEVIGSLDGIPARDRHEANLAVLDKQITEVNETQAERLREIRDRIEASRTDADNADDLYLLKLDTSGDGKIIVSIGDPDTADDVSVYVPGTTASLWGGLDVDLDRAQTMFDAANKKGGSVASVLWLDYDAPDSVLLHAHDPSYADKGGPTLRSFVDSLKTTHEGGGLHTTLVAHSYASLVVSEAAQQSPGMEADIVTVGGAGFGLDDVSGVDVEKALNLKGDVYSATGGSDLIRAAHGLEVHGDGPSELSGTEKLGVSVFTGHTGYWDDSTFLDDVTNVITGDKDAVSGPSALQQFVDDVLEVESEKDEALGDVGENILTVGTTVLDVLGDGVDTAKGFLKKVF
ncbi:alpha/beta hydrolase [Saccharomonospora sp. NB11]|jgi:hypothetical protein|uniref:alpha/beta hydrolase n=1 Tax=Saccharomonospora sp. NB11 TaxID=1642298 RepID=UPI0018D04166|nr:alpha/beta hydrolase [Saccharomonospora sp. NB11]